MSVLIGVRWLGFLALFCMFLFPRMVLASASEVYIAQSSAGAADGSSCANARAVTFFNTAGNWGAGATQIGAGTVVRLCGTITSSMTFQADGSSGNPVVVDGTGATMNSGFDTGPRAWWVIQNVTFVSGSTAQLVYIFGGTNGVVTGCTADNFAGDPAVFLGQASGGTSLSHDITVSNNFFRTTTSDLGDTQHDIIKTEGSYNVIIEGNYLEMRVPGGSPWTNSHNDIIQTYQKGGASAGNPRDWIIRHNFFVMNTTQANHRSMTLLEHFSGTAEIYGNVYLGIQGAQSALGLAMNNDVAPAGTFNVYNNTFVAKNGPNNVVAGYAGTVNLRNNIIKADGGVTALSLQGATVNRSYNHWIGSSIPSCSGVTGELCGTSPAFTDETNNDFTLQASSPDKGAGNNFGSPYNVGLDESSTWPGPTTANRTVPWDRGAFVFAEAVGNPPSVTIIAPNGGNNTTVTTTPLTSLEGTASDPDGAANLNTITVSCNPSCGSPSVSGTTSWSVASLPLTPGDNVITVTATDNDSNTAQDQITVTYNAPADITSNLLSWWKLYNSYTDFGSNAQDATPVNSPTFDSAGNCRNGQGCLLLNGTNQYATVVQNGEYNLHATAFTLAAWIRDDTSATQLNSEIGHRLLSWDDGTNGINVFLTSSDGTNRIFGIQNTATNTIQRVTVTSAATGQWHHVAVTFDGTSTYKLYLNGTQTDTTSGSTSTPSSDTTTLYIGQRGDTNGFVNGRLQDLRVYARALNQVDIDALVAFTEASTAAATVLRIVQ